MEPTGSSKRHRGASRSPVLVSLASVLGGHIDGAWWPRTAAMAREPPDLVEALYPTLGDVVGIDINWSAYSPTPVLSTMSPDIAAKIGRAAPHHRLMVLARRISGHQPARGAVDDVGTPGHDGAATGRRTSDRRLGEASKEFQAADRVMRAAGPKVPWAAVRAGRPAE